MTRLTLAACAILLAALAAPASVPARAGDEVVAAPPSVEVRAAPSVEQAIERGVAYLLASQNADGSWGTPASNLWDIYAPVPGSQRAFEVASTALALGGLLEAGGGRPGVEDAVAKARAYLLRRPVVRRIRPDTLYNTWALIYALEAFARLLEREPAGEGRVALLDAGQQCVQALQRYEFVEGGWGYYNFSEQTRAPGPGSTSFTSASGVVALTMAARQGVKVPARLLARAAELVRRCGRPDGAYAYSYRTTWWPTAGINQTKGSLARTPACVLAEAEAGHEVDPRRFVQALDELEQYGHFLRIARKYPRPHESWYQNSGYFCFYGYYYAGLLLGRVPATVRARHAERIAAHLVALQEKDGSWWDYQLFNYHKAYGTGYVLLALAACRRS